MSQVSRSNEQRMFIADRSVRATVKAREEMLTLVFASLLGFQEIDIMQNAERVCSVHTGCLTCHCRQPKEMEAGGTRRPLGQRLAIHCKIQSWTPLSPTLCCTWPVQEDLGGRLRTPDPHTGGGV
mmetsp:Transcript_87276/g.154646  ORF Transcript_87276/g.154646 Transcript_87276/m.154646 type:complete len:125 (+) Transcript_87276:2-376(+)